REVALVRLLLRPVSMRAIGLLLLAGCSLDLDLTSDATSIRATARGDGTTEVRVCAGPSGLLSCNAKETFHVTVAGAAADAVPDLSGGLVATLPVDGEGASIVVRRARDGATATAVLPEPFQIGGPAAASRAGGAVTVTWAPS